MVDYLLEHIIGQIRNRDHFKKWLNSSDEVKRVRSDLVENLVAQAEFSKLANAAARRLGLLLRLLTWVHQGVKLLGYVIEVFDLLNVIDDFVHVFLVF